MFRLFRDYHQKLTQFSGNVKWYLVALTLNSIGIGMYEVIYNLYLKQLEFDSIFTGKSISLKALASVLIYLPAGFFSDRLGRRKSMITGVVFLGACYVSMGFIEAGGFILTVAFLNGLFNSFFMVAQSPFMMENTSPRERMHLFSINSALMTGAWMMGNLLGGWIPDFLVPWFSTLTAMKITLVLSALVILAGTVPLLQIREQNVAEKRSFGQIIDALRDRKVLANIGKFVIPSIFVGFGAGLFVPYTNLYLSSFAMSTSAIGVTMAVSQVMTAIATLMGPLLVNKVGRVRAIFVFQMVSLPFLFIMATTGNVYLAIVGVLLRATLMNAANPLTSSLMMEEVAPHVKGIANSLTGMSFQLGWAVMGPISGMIISKTGYSNIFFLAMFFYLASAVSYYVFFRHLDPQPREVAA